MTPTSFNWLIFLPFGGSLLFEEEDKLSLSVSLIGGAALLRSDVVTLSALVPRLLPALTRGAGRPVGVTGRVDEFTDLPSPSADASDLLESI